MYSMLDVAHNNGHQVDKAALNVARPPSWMIQGALEILHILGCRFSALKTLVMKVFEDVVLMHSTDEVLVSRYGSYLD